MKELKGILRSITNKVQSFIKRMIERIIKVPTEQEKQERIKKEKKFWKKFDCIIKSIWRLFWMGVILHVAEYFWPELPNKIPVIYGLYDYLMQIPEFIFWTTFKGLQAILEGNFLEFSSKEFWPSVKNGIECFIEWIKAL